MNTEKDTPAAVAGNGATPAPGRKSAPVKEVPPFEWKLIGYSQGIPLTLLKCVDKADAEAQMGRYELEGYYKNLEIVPIDTKIPLPKAALELFDEKEAAAAAAAASSKASSDAGSRTTKPLSVKSKKKGASGKAKAAKKTTAKKPAAKKAAVKKVSAKKKTAEKKAVKAKKTTSKAKPKTKTKSKTKTKTKTKTKPKIKTGRKSR